jgi:hypothetical protein
MSQHIFITRQDHTPVQVLMGWDRPLQGFFLVIDRLQIGPLAHNDYDEGDHGDCDEGEDEQIYSNLSDPDLHIFNGLPPTLTYFRQMLKQLRIDVPEPMLTQILLDQVNNTGNAYMDHSVIVATDSGVKIVPDTCLVPGSHDCPTGLLRLVDFEGKTIANLACSTPWDLSSIYSTLSMPKVIEDVAAAGAVTAYIDDLWIGSTEV